jgi:long-subunit acyl-CoA synthetase (AMP-forming)
VAHVLRGRYGIGARGPGQDVIVSTSSGNPFIPVLFYSIVAAGGVYSGASSAFTVAELVRQAKDADAKVLLCSPEFERHTVEAAKQCGIPSDYILIIDAKQPKNWKLISAADRSNVLKRNGLMLDWKRITNERELQDTIACLLYSSGTTGLPKGVEISHWNLIAVNVCWMPLAQRYRDRRRKERQPFHFSTIAHLPMAHIGGISWSSLIPFYAGGTAYWVEKYEFSSFIEYHKRYCFPQKERKERCLELI